MNLQHPFYKFAFRFDVERLRREVEAIPEESWRWHHENFKGNSALHLISTDGGINDAFEPPMMPTEHLLACPYIMQVMAHFKTLMGRARLMRLEPGAGVPAHFDIQHYWRTHTRVHIPIVTDPAIRFHCDTQNVHMAAGEAWTFDNWRVHKVVNETQTRRIHLTFDTYGSTAFWNMAKLYAGDVDMPLVPYRDGAVPALELETFIDNPVMAPGEVEMELSRFASDIASYPDNDPAAVGRVIALISGLRNEWRTVWFGPGPTDAGLAEFAMLQERALQVAMTIPESVKMASNGRPLVQAFPSTLSALVRPAALEKLKSLPRKAPVKPAAPRLDRPVFIVSAPRSGSTLLFELLSSSDGFWTIGGEGHGHVENIEALNPRSRGMESNRLTAADAGAGVREKILARYLADLRAADGALAGGAIPGTVRFLEKTPKNALRIPFFKAMFPDAKFIFLHREPRANISAIMEAWRSGRFVTYPDLDGWTGLPWSLLLIPGWRDLRGHDVAEIAMRQWRDTNDIILNDLAAMPSADWCSLRYEDLVSDPAGTLRRLCNFADVPFSDGIAKVSGGALKPSRYTLSTPSAEKWRKNEAAIKPFLDSAKATAQKLEALPHASKSAGAASSLTAAM